MDASTEGLESTRAISNVLSLAARGSGEAAVSTSVSSACPTTS